VKRRQVVALLLTGTVLAGVVWYAANRPLDATTPGEVCEVHSTPLAEDTVPIVYGLPPRLTQEQRDRIIASFPHARTYYGGGCVVGSKTKARVSYCPECREAQAKWEADHPR
jgi:hypothetical protein